MCTDCLDEYLAYMETFVEGQIKTCVNVSDVEPNEYAMSPQDLCSLKHTVVEFLTYYDCELTNDCMKPSEEVTVTAMVFFTQKKYRKRGPLFHIFTSHARTKLS